MRTPSAARMRLAAATRLDPDRRRPTGGAAAWKALMPARRAGHLSLGEFAQDPGEDLAAVGGRVLEDRLPRGGWGGPGRRGDRRGRGAAPPGRASPSDRRCRSRSRPTRRGLRRGASWRAAPPSPGPPGTLRWTRLREWRCQALNAPSASRGDMSVITFKQFLLEGLAVGGARFRSKPLCSVYQRYSA